MQKNIAIGVALLVLAVIFVFGGFKISEHRGETTNSEGKTDKPLSLLPSFASDKVELPALGGGAMAASAWENFQSYLSAAKEHDLDKLKSLSHQLSPACTDEARREECNTLMDSVYFFANGLKREDFKNIAQDSRQLILSTDYIMIEGAEEPMKSVLYFVIDEKTREPKILGLRFCVGDESKNGDECVVTEANRRDQDKNGWWDDVEELFR